MPRAKDLTNAEDKKLFPELDETDEHKKILSKARLAKRLRESASKAKDERDDCQDKLIEMMEDAKLKAFSHDGVDVKINGKKSLSIRTRRKDDPKVAAAE